MFVLSQLQHLYPNMYIIDIVYPVFPEGCDVPADDAGSCSQRRRVGISIAFGRGNSHNETGGERKNDPENRAVAAH